MSREDPPEYDESAEHVIVSVKNPNDKYHRPAADGTDEPACTEANCRGPAGDTEWVRLGRDTSKFTKLSLCGHCRGRRDPGVPNNGSGLRHKLLNSTPEDFGLDPLPEASGHGGAD